MPELSTSRFMIRDSAEPCGLRITNRQTMATALLDAQAAADLLNHAAKLAGYRLTGPTFDKAMDWLVESYVQ